jgi:hypothetical protein
MLYQVYLPLKTEHRQTEGTYMEHCWDQVVRELCAGIIHLSQPPGSKNEDEHWALHG